MYFKTFSWPLTAMEPTVRPGCSLREFLSNRGVVDELIDKLEHEKVSFFALVSPP